MTSDDSKSLLRTEFKRFVTAQNHLIGCILTSLTFLQSNRWLKGPEFLWKPEEEWIKQPVLPGLIPASDPEVKDEVSNCVTNLTCSDNPVKMIIEHYSDWHRLKRAVVIFLRLKSILLRLSKDRKDQNHLNRSEEPFMTEQRKASFRNLSLPITVLEMEKAENNIFKYIHEHQYAEELKVLRSADFNQNNRRQQFKCKKLLTKNLSNLWKLDPVINNGVLRVGGRLDRADVSEPLKHLVIVPRKDHLTELIIRHAHQRLAHAGRGHVLAFLREKYWIIGANAAVRQVITKCVPCRRNRAKPNRQKMADFASRKIQPLTTVGLDYFGPFYIKGGRRELKRYGAIFTCLASRSIHIEVSNSLETDSFIQALQRFISRRGPVRQIRSDNGSNFIGAEKELRQDLDEWTRIKLEINCCISTLIGYLTPQPQATWEEFGSAKFAR